jgi:DNA-binding MarR family transcriptional regulator
LRRLEQRGLLEIGPDQRDRRATRVRLTRLGLTARDDVVGFRREKIAEIAAVLDLDPGLAGPLTRIADAMDRTGCKVGTASEMRVSVGSMPRVLCG